MTGDRFQDKRTHTLWASGSADEFVARVGAELGLDIDTLLARFASPERVLLAVVGGSIPLGMGNPASDVDLLLIVDSTETLPEVAPSSRSHVVFRSHPDALVVVEATTIVNAVEVDAQIVLRARLHELLGRVSRGQAALTQEERTVLSRLASGWRLAGDGTKASSLWSSDWRMSLGVFCATRDYVFALKMFEDAVAEAATQPSLCLHLGRLATEFGYRAFFSSRGYTAPGNKWMLLLDPRHDFRTRHLEGTRLGAAAALNFPAMSDAAGAVRYLRDVADFLVDVRLTMERDAAMKIALRVCAQVYPVAAPAERAS